MQERRLRLGDVLDDYCPREKRLTNHVIVALVEDEIRQARCTTCDTEHPYKQGRVPVRRKKADEAGALYAQVLDGLTGKDGSPAEPPVEAQRVATVVPVPPTGLVPPARPAVAPAQPDAAALAAVAPEDEERPAEPVHRHQLIRATLPRIEGQIPERKPAEFTSWHVAQHAQARKGRRDQRGAVDGNAGYSPYANGHPKPSGNTSGRPPQGASSRRNRRGGR